MAACLGSGQCEPLYAWLALVGLHASASHAWVCRLCPRVAHAFAAEVQGAGLLGAGWPRRRETSVQAAALAAVCCCAGRAAACKLYLQSPVQAAGGAAATRTASTTDMLPLAMKGRRQVLGDAWPHKRRKDKSSSVASKGLHLGQQRSRVCWWAYCGRWGSCPGCQRAPARHLSAQRLWLAVIAYEAAGPPCRAPWKCVPL